MNTTEQPSNPFWSEFVTPTTTSREVASTSEQIERNLMESFQLEAELEADQSKRFVFTAGSGKVTPTFEDEEFAKSNLNSEYGRDTVSNRTPTTKTKMPDYEEFQAMLQADRDEMSEIKRVTRVRAHLDAMARRERYEAGFQPPPASSTQQFSNPKPLTPHAGQFRTPAVDSNVDPHVKEFETAPAMHGDFNHNEIHGESISVTEDFHAALLSMRNNHNHNGYGREYDEAYSSNALEGFEELLSMQDIEARKSHFNTVVTSQHPSQTY